MWDLCLFLLIIFKAIMLIIVVLVVKESSVIKELVADVEVMEEVCDLLNQINRTTTVSGLRNLGNRLKIKKEILDDLLPSMEVNQSPTEALIRRLGGSNPSLTLVDFIWALHEISRPDVIVLLDEYLPGMEFW